MYRTSFYQNTNYFKIKSFYMIQHRKFVSRYSPWSLYAQLSRPPTAQLTDTFNVAPICVFDKIATPHPRSPDSSPPPPFRWWIKGLFVSWNRRPLGQSDSKRNLHLWYYIGLLESGRGDLIPTRLIYYFYLGLGAFRDKTWCHFLSLDAGMKHIRMLIRA